MILKITVSDTGEGMTEAVQKRIFDPFFTTRSPEGTGMGLPVIQGIVQSHNGLIRVKSEPGKVSSFSVLIPKAKLYQRTKPGMSPQAGRNISCL